MRAVFSLWTAPKRAEFLIRSPHNRLCALAVNLAHEHFTSVELITDSAGARHFDWLPWSEIHVTLDTLNIADVRIWALGKLVAHKCAAAHGPYIHCDFDVLLWRPLPHRVLTASLVAERRQEYPTERFQGQHYYELEFATALPKDLAEIARYRVLQPAICAGIIGGSHTDFLSEYSALACELANTRKIRLFTDVRGGTSAALMLEQWLYGALAIARNIEISDLLTPDAFPCTPADIRRHGYTHLSNETKTSSEWVAIIDRELRDRYPAIAEKLDNDWAGQADGRDAAKTRPSSA